MSKKGENIHHRKDGRWEARYIKERNSDGSIKYGYLYAHTYKEVKAKQQYAISNMLQPNIQKNSITENPSMEMFCYQWQAAVRYTMKESSFVLYNFLLSKHIIPFFRFYKISQITTELIQKFSHSMSQEGLSPATVRSILVLLKTILSYGEKCGFLRLNKIQIIYPKNDISSISVLNSEDSVKLITYLIEQEDPFSMGFLLSIFTGIRVGELCALQWKDFNLNEGTLSISKTVSRIKNLEHKLDSANNPNFDLNKPVPKTKLVITSPKSLTSYRKIPIPEFMMPNLTKLYTAEENYILTNTQKCSEPRNMQRRFKTILKRCEIPSINLHALRHTFATKCTESGVDYKTLSEILGHSSSKITMDTYVHSNMQMKRNYMNQLQY